MAEITDLVVIDANNIARWPEGMPFSSVNNAARADEGMLARWYLDTNGSLAATGPANAYAVTANRAIVAYLDKWLVAFTPNGTNTGSATLNVSGLGAITITRPDGSALLPGDIVAGQVVLVVYLASANKFQLLSMTPPQPSAAIPVGTIMAWPLTAAQLPVGSPMLECNGQAVSRTTYAALFAAIGTAYGVGDGSTTFNVPNYSGYFLRGQDHGAGRDPDAATRTARPDGTSGDNPGTTQTSQVGPHGHTGTASITDPGHAHDEKYNNQANQSGSGASNPIPIPNSGGTQTATGAAVSNTTGISASITINATTTTETRALNINVLWVIVALPAAALPTFTANPSTLIVTVPGINMNAVADTVIPIALPAGYTRYRVEAAVVSHASTNLTSATAVQYGLFTAAAGGGTAVVTTVTSTVSVTTENTANNIQALSPINASLNVAALYFRVSTAHGAAATADLTLYLQLMP